MSRNYSRAGEAVYEPFMGSGTTLIAAEQSGRRCFGLELNPAYVDVAVERWEDFTGERATRASDGARRLNRGADRNFAFGQCEFLSRARLNRQARPE